MEESKEERVLVCSVSEPVAVAGDESEILVESLATEVLGRGRIEGLSTEEVVEEGKVCDKRNFKDSGGDVSGLGIEGGAGDSSMLSVPSDGQDQGADETQGESVEIEKKTIDDKGVVTNDKRSLPVERINDEGQDDRVGTCVDGSAEAVTSTEIKSQNLQTVEVVAREGYANENVNTQVVGRDLLGDGVKDGEGAHTTEEAVNVVSEEKSRGTLVEEGVDRMKMVDDEADVVQDIKMPDACNSVHGIQNSLTETNFASSPTTEKDFSSHNQATEVEAAASFKQDEAKGGNSLDGTVNNSNMKHISVTKRVSGEPERESVDSTRQGSLDERKIATLKGEFTMVGNEEFTCSKVEGMDIDALNENLYFTLEELTSHVETNGGITENHCNPIADSMPLSQPVQVTSCLEIAAVDDKAPSNSERECLDHDIALNVAHVDSKLEPCNGFDKQVIQPKEVRFHDEFETDVEQRESKGETINGDSGINFHVQVNATTSCQSSSADVGDKISVNSISNFDISDYVDLDGKLSCSGKEHNLTAEMASGVTIADVQAIDGHAESASRPMETQELVADIVPCVIQGGAVEGTNIVGSAAIDQSLKTGETVDESAACGHLEVNSNVRKEMKVVEQAIDAEESNICGGHELEVDEQDPGQTNTMEEKIIKQAVLDHGSSVKKHEATYQLPLEEDGMFCVSDLVWGKVRSHPWWPGQILDPSDASEKAMKYQRKDCFLVGYFGDHTFAWNEACLLKPFRTHFSQVEKQSSFEAFQNAVNCALKEVSRRVELGLSCSCTPKDTYEKIRYQIVENTGIQGELSKRGGVDKSTSATCFEPAKLVEYLKALAQSPSGGADRLELVIAKAQLLSFYRLKGFNQLPEFQHIEQFPSGQEILAIRKGSYHKRKHNLKDSDFPGKKERSLSELMDEWDPPEDEFEPDGKSANKRRAVDSFADDSANQEGRKTISFAKVSLTTPSIPRPSFKIGECIRRVAPSILKCTSDKFQKLDGSSDRLYVEGLDAYLHNFEDAEKIRMIVPMEYLSLDELLSQLHLAARDPSGGYEFFDVIASFFSDFRNSVILEQVLDLEKGGRKRRMSHPMGNSPETFEFEDMNDTYWTDRVIENGSEEQTLHKSKKREIDHVQGSHRSFSRRRYSDSDDVAARKPVGLDENSPAELVMNFSEVNTVPSEMNLNKMFKHFGPLKESETEVDKEASRARVVFKRCCDAEAAFSSAGKFGIFGPVAVNYQLNYTVSAPFRTPLVTTIQGDEYTTLCLEY